MIVYRHVYYIKTREVVLGNVLQVPAGLRSESPTMDRTRYCSADSGIESKSESESESDAVL
jgi:hypothetical protein